MKLIFCEYFRAVRSPCLCIVCVQCQWICLAQLCWCAAAVESVMSTGILSWWLLFVVRCADRGAAQSVNAALASSLSLNLKISVEQSELCLCARSCGSLPARAQYQKAAAFHISCSLALSPSVITSVTDIFGLLGKRVRSTTPTYHL